MATYYDTGHYSVDEHASGDVVFNFICPAQRTITFASFRYILTTNPNATITGTITLNGATVSDSSFSISTSGVVTMTLLPITLTEGDHLQITLNADADVPSTKAKGIGLTLVGTSPDEDNGDSRYDISIFIEGKIKSAEKLAEIRVPRTFNMYGTGFQAAAGTNVAAVKIFTLQQNASPIGTFTLYPNGLSAINLTTAPTAFTAGDIFTIIAPGSTGYTDPSLEDLSITFKGFLA